MKKCIAENHIFDPKAFVLYENFQNTAVSAFQSLINFVKYKLTIVEITIITINCVFSTVSIWFSLKAILPVVVFRTVTLLLPVNGII